MQEYLTSSQHRLYTSGSATTTEPGIHAFTFDSASGSLAADWSLTGIVNPSFIVLHPHRRWLYAASETSLHKEGRSGEVWAVGLPERENGPRLLNHRASGGDCPCHLAIDTTGKWLLVSNYASGTLGVLPLLADGTLGELAELVQHHGSGPNPERQEGPHVHSTIFTPDNRFIIAADLGIDQLVIYAFDPANGHLRVHDRVETRPGAGPRHMTFHTSGQYLYVAHELDNTVAVYSYDAGRGSLAWRQIVETLPPGAPVSTVADIHLAPTGDRLYVSNRGHDSIAVFTLAADGRLERQAVAACGGRWPRNFAFAPDGRFLLVANQYSNEVTVLPVLNEGDEIGEPHVRASVLGASCVQFAAENAQDFLS